MFCCSFLVSSLLFNLSAISGRIRLHVLFRHGEDFVAVSIFVSFISKVDQSPSLYFHSIYVVFIFNVLTIPTFQFIISFWWFAIMIYLQHSPRSFSFICILNSRHCLFIAGTLARHVQINLSYLPSLFFSIMFSLNLI